MSYKEIAKLAIEGLAIASEFLADLHDLLPEGENKDAVRAYGLGIIQGGESLLDAFEAELYAEKTTSDVEVERDGSAALRNEVVNFAGLTFFLDRILGVIAENSEDDAAVNTCNTARDVVVDVIAALPDVDGDEARGFETIKFADQLWEEAGDRAEFQYADEDLAA